MKITIVEDEPNIVSFLERGLTENNYKVQVACNGEDGWELLQNNNADLILLDLMLPGIIDGWELCRKFREKFGYETPILMLTALNTIDDIVKGLDVGADDYLAKPFRFQELLARVNALLRRNTKKEINLLQFSDLTLNRKNRTATRGNQLFNLTVKEFRLLEHFMLHPETVLSRTQLLEHVWDISFDPNTNVVDVYINFLRNKIDRNFNINLLHTIIGVGYVLKEENSMLHEN